MVNLIKVRYNEGCNMKKTLICFAFFSFLVSLAVLVPIQQKSGSAQTFSNEPNLIISWHPFNFYPADYYGKPIPSPGTPVLVSVEALQGGKLLDLSKASFSWEIDGKFLTSGVGIKEALFTSQQTSKNSQLVRVTVTSEGNRWEASIGIPVVRPLVVIDAPFPDRRVEGGTPVTLYALPFFFPVQQFEDLTFSWSVDNGEKIESSLNDLSITVESAQGGEARKVLIVGRIIADGLIPILGENSIFLTVY